MFLNRARVKKVLLWGFAASVIADLVGIYLMRTADDAGTWFLGLFCIVVSIASTAPVVGWLIVYVTLRYILGGRDEDRAL